MLLYAVDDNYPAAFLYLWGQPALIDALLRPVNLFMMNLTFTASAPFPHNISWPHRYSIHYLGQYPIAELQCCECFLRIRTCC